VSHSSASIASLLKRSRISTDGVSSSALAIAYVLRGERNGGGDSGENCLQLGAGCRKRR
jgi:hypothetical protein